MRKISEFLECNWKRWECCQQVCEFSCCTFKLFVLQKRIQPRMNIQLIQLIQSNVPRRIGWLPTPILLDFSDESAFSRRRKGTNKRRLYFLLFHSRVEQKNSHWHDAPCPSFSPISGSLIPTPHCSDLSRDLEDHTLFARRLAPLCVWFTCDFFLTSQALDSPLRQGRLKYGFSAAEVFEKERQKFEGLITVAVSDPDVWITF